MNEQLQQIIDAVKAASPFVWHAAYRYVIVDSFIGMGIAVAFFPLAQWLKGLAKKTEDEGVFFCYVGMIICLIVGSVLFFANLEQLLTLDYNAMKAISQLAVKP